MSAGAARVAVVVPVWNAGATIDDTLAALAAQRLDEPFDVVFVDGGSTDGTLERLAGAGDTVTVLPNPDRDPASARNLGVRWTTGEVLAFTDADCAPAPDWLAAGIARLRELDLVQGRVLPADDVGPFDRTVSVGAEQGLYETANLFVRRAMFERVDGFAPLPGLNLPDGSHFGEDAWFAWRCRRAGARTGFAPDAVVHHAVHHRNAADFVREQWRTRYFPPLVALIPELRGTFAHHRWFLSPASLRFDVAVAGALAATAARRWPPALAGALPYASWLVKTARRSGDRPVGVAATYLAADALTLAGLVWGSVRARTPLL